MLTLTYIYMSNSPIKPIRAIYSLIRNYQRGSHLAQRGSRYSIILGNGPSLREDISDLISLKMSHGIDFWCVNFFAETELYEQIKPEFYVLADPSFWTPTVSLEIKEQRNNFVETLKKKTTWKTTVYLPLGAKNSGLPERLITSMIDVKFFNTTTFNSTSLELNFWIYKHLLAMPQCQNVLIGALYLAIVSKYDCIYLFGVDHSWINNIQVAKDNTVFVGRAHFYDEGYSQPIRGQGVGKAWSLSRILNIYSIIFRQYEILEKLAKKLGVKVINGCSCSLIDAFERAPASSIFSRLSENKNLADHSINASIE